MTFEEMLKREERKGEEKFGKLVLKLVELGRLEDLKRSAIDDAFLHQRYIEFGLDEEKTE